MSVEDMVARKAEGDGLYAVAWALAEVARAIRGLDESLRSDHPLQGQTFEGVEVALQAIAEAIDNHG